MSQRINVTTDSERSRHNPPGYGRPPFIMRIPWWFGVLLALLLATLCLPVAAVLVVVGLLALLVSLLFRRRRPYVVRTQRAEVLHIALKSDGETTPPPPPPQD